MFDEIKTSKSEKRTFPLWLSGLRTQLVSMRMLVQSLTPLSGLRILTCHGLRYWLQIWLGWHLVLLWLWRRLAAAALVQPLAQELL